MYIKRFKGQSIKLFSV